MLVMARVFSAAWRWVSNVSTAQWVLTGGSGIVAYVATGLAWLRTFELPLIMFMGVGAFAIILIIASRVKLVMDRITEKRLLARIAELESQLAAAHARNAVEDARHRDAMDAQFSIASALREQALGNRG